MASSNLAEVETRWLKLFHELRVRRGQDRGPIARLFLSVRPHGYNPSALPSVLYIGKATNGSWNPTCDQRSVTVENTREYTRHFLDREAKTYTSAFWRFARELSERMVAATGGENIRPFQNLVWTNLCKIGVAHGTPSGTIRLAQRGLAVETLRLEIEAYDPKLIVLVTGDFEDELIAELARDPSWKSWHKSRQQGWWREATGKMPAILWIGHPQGKSRDLRKIWLRQAERLAAQ